LLLKVFTPIAGAKVEAKRSVVNMREVFEVATLDASSNMAFAAA
jgi:hypothetical protein